MIEVILLERIERLGQMGQVVKVRPGFARNFLLPQKKALRATKSNLDLFEKQRANLEATNAKERAAAQATAGKVDGAVLTLIRQASESGQLYGSVSARDIADAGKESGFSFIRAQVQIDTPVKTLGLFPIKVKLHPEVTIKVTINVARSPEEADVQAKKGAAVTGNAEAVAEEVAATSAEGKEASAKKPARKAKASKAAEAAEGEDEEKAPKAAKKPRVKKAG